MMTETTNTVVTETEEGLEVAGKMTWEGNCPLDYYNREVLEKLGKVSKRMVKMGLQPLESQITRQYEVTYKTDSEFTYTVTFVEFTVTGDRPKFKGWRLLGVLAPQENGEVLLNNVPGMVIPEQYRTSTGYECDHCKVIRSRSETFVIGHDDGRTMQVGRQCLKDFLGHNVDRMISWYDSLDEVGVIEEDDFWGGMGGFVPRCFLTEDYLAVVMAFIRGCGWVSSTMARMSFDGTTPTASHAWTEMSPKPPQHHKDLVKTYNIAPQESDHEYVAKVLAWARGLTGGSDYLYNLGVACRQETVDYERKGIVASAIAAYKREVEREEKVIAERKALPESNWVGEPKQRLVMEAEVTYVQYFESDYGPARTLVKMRDTTGNDLVWWATAEVDWAVKGNKVKIKGTVKKHDTYKERKQTNLSRVALVELVEGTLIRD